MDTRSLASLGRDRRDTLSYDVLRIRLSRVDHVIYRFAVTEFRSLLVGGWIGCCDPNLSAICVFVKGTIEEVQTEDAEFPHLVRDVFAGVGHRAVRTDEDLVGLVLVCAGV